MNQAPAPRQSHDIEYEVHGNELQFVEVVLDPGESVVAEAGSMLNMDAGISMETVLGDGSAMRKGMMGAVMGAGARLLTGEKLFMTIFTNVGSGKQKVAFSAPYPGTILPVDLKALGGYIVAQKEAFLCAARGTTLGIAFQKRIGAGLFGGEGFILQKIAGDGLAFLHAGGMIVERDLQAGEMIRVDNGCVVAFQPGVDYDLRVVNGIKSMLFGGEGLFLAELKGPGKVWLQSMPYGRIIQMIQQSVLQQVKRNRK